MKQLFLIISACFLAMFSHAQFNDSTFYHINYSSTGVLNKTNDNNSFLLTNALRFNVSKKSVTINFNSTWLYGEQRKALTNNDFSTTLDFNLYKTFPHFYYWGLGTFDKSFSLKINQRIQAGLGIAYNVVDNKNAFLGISNGVLYEKSDLQQVTGQDKYETLRNSFRLKFRWVIMDRLVLDGTNFLQNSLSDKKDYTIKAVDNFSVKVTKWFSLTTSLNYNMINRTERESLLVTYGITIDKYF